VVREPYKIQLLHRLRNRRADGEGVVDVDVDEEGARNEQYWDILWIGNCVLESTVQLCVTEPHRTGIRSSNKVAMQR